MRTEHATPGAARNVPPPWWRRWAAFNLVGVSGAVIQLVTLALLRGGLGLHYLAATALAVETAVLHNFAWHEAWTWADRTAGDRSGIPARLARFNLTTGAISIGANLVLMGLLVHGLGIHYLAANVLTIGACSVLNFLASDRWVFRSGVPVPAVVKAFRDRPGGEEQSCA